MYPDDDEYEPSVRDRLYGRATGSHEGRRAFVGVLLSISVLVLVVSVSCRQVTAPGPARNIIESGIVSLTDIDQLIADDGPALRQLAIDSQGPIVIPGYPLDVILTREEVIESSDAELRRIILERSSGLIYAEGLDAFDRTGDQSIRLVSLQGVLQFGVSQVSETTHQRANFFALISLLGVAVFGAIVAATGEGFGRMRTLGIATIMGSAPAFLFFLITRFSLGGIGGDDPFVDGLRNTTRAAVDVPLRNSLIVLIAGLLLTASAVVLSRIERMGSPGEPASEDGW